MSSTIDIGIDLGTTNSVAAVMEDGRPVVVKNEESDITPSFVGVGPQGQIFTGQKARTISLHDLENVADGFKRQLGYGHIWRFPASGRTFSAINLAAILLRDIRQAISEHINSEPKASVITVPAAFGEVEKHAVALSAREAGFTQVTLVQEPVAAGLAYGWQKKSEGKPFLVYDIGGGTFDAALMEYVGGQLIVRANAGEHTLGGRELDKEILDKLVLTQIAGKADPATVTAARRRLLWKCEDAKIRLSRSASAIVSLEGCVRSISGTPLVDALTIARADYESLVIPFVDRTIEIVLRLLSQAGLGTKDIGAVMLVGGPSKTPILRRRLEERLQVAHEVIFAGIDPMTVVAQGAALYAASVEKSATVVNPPPPNSLQIRILHDPVTSLSSAPVGIAVDSGIVPSGTMVRISRQDGLWATGLIPVRDGKAMTQVLLVDGQQSHFKIDFLTPSGSVSVYPDTFSILQGISSVSPPLSRSIGVIVEKSETDSLGVDIIAKKGTPTPSINRGTYRTTRTIRPGDPESGLTVTFVEGESPKPMRNKILCTVPIYGTDVDRPLPVGTEVEITLRIDPSASAVAKVFIPVLGKIFTDKAVIDVGVRQDPVDLTKRLTIEAQRLKGFADAGEDITKLQKELSLISRELELAKNGDNDSLARAEQQLDALAQGVDGIENRAGPQIALQFLNEVETWAEAVIGDYGEEGHKRRLLDLKTKAVSVRFSQNPALIRNISDQLLRLAQEVYWAQRSSWEAQFKKLVDKGDFIDQTKARQLIAEGRRLLDEDEQIMFARIVWELGKLAPEGITDPDLARFGGLMKLQ